jgi:predicted RNase H-like HicB family nuclease
VEQFFTLVVERDPESKMYVGEVIELPGCYTQAEDLQSLERNAREAITAHLAALSGKDEQSPEFIGTWRLKIAS